MTIGETGIFSIGLDRTQPATSTMFTLTREEPYSPLVTIAVHENRILRATDALPAILSVGEGLCVNRKKFPLFNPVDDRLGLILTPVLVTAKK